MKNILEFSRKDVQRTPVMEVGRTRLAQEHDFTLRVAAHDISPADAAELIRFWSPAGCLVNNDILPPEIFADVPTIFFHRNLAKIPKNAVLIKFDEQSVVNAVARELLSLEIKSYAFAPSLSGEYWCTQREEYFKRIMALNGCVVNVFAPSKQAVLKNSRYQADLQKWIRDLPHPVGIFAACDRVAQNVLNICSLLDVKVPDDVVVIGVDNIEQICECTMPTLSSIAFDWHSLTELTFSKLDELISSKAKSGGKQALFQPQGLVRRASSMRFKRIDHAVITALDMIRRKACDTLSVGDVVKVFSCSRRMAEIRFRAATGRSILDVIRETRREKALEMVSFKELPRDMIAASCGYRSWISIKRLLKS